MADIKLVQEVQKFHQFALKMAAKLKDPSQQIELKLNHYSEQFGSFFGSASSQIRARFSYHIQKQIRNFLRQFVLQKIQLLVNPNIDPYYFIQVLCQIWSNYQRFIFALKFYTNSADNTYKNFHKFAAKFQTLLTTQHNLDKLAHPKDREYKNQVSPVPVMSVNQLKQFLKNEKLLDPLISNFVKIFCTFLKKQRQGLNTPRDRINQALQFAEALYLDYDCDCVRRNDRIKIIKALNAAAPVNRKSTADTFFEKTFTQSIFIDCETYYRFWVDNKSFLLNVSEEMKQILKFVQAEEGRSKFYIHDQRNEKKYLEIVQKYLIEYRLQQKLAKRNGFSYFLQSYELDKPEMMQQINNFWSVWKRICQKQNKSKDIILSIYQAYLKQQGIIVSQAFQKPSQFIEQTIRLNKKNVQIVSKLLGNKLQFNRTRVNIMQMLLSMKYVEKQGVKQYFGSKHWAAFLNMKLKVKYSKTQKYSQYEEDLVGLFKLLIHKLIAINEHCKLLNSRLLEDIDMSLEGQYSNAIDLQLKILDQIKKEAAENQIKAIQNCIKDVQSSLQLRSKLKQSKKMAQYGFFNQIIRKSGNYWVDTSMYDIQPPIVLRNCITTIRNELESQNLVFQLQNGTSLFTGTINKQIHKFQLRNIYLMILLLIDQKPNKKIFYTDLLKQIRPIGVTTPKSLLQLVRCLIELTMFGIVKCSKQFTAQSCDIQNWTASDYFQINLAFKPLKKLQCYRTPMLANLPDFLKKAFAAKLQVVDSEQKKIEKDRRFRVEGDCVRLLKHAQTLDGGKGTIGIITFDQLLKGMRRENNVNAKYLKQVIEHLINNGLCQRVEDKKNTYKYKS